jgi:hypothetical protein
MKTAIEKGKELPPHILAFSSKTLVMLQRAMPQLEQNIQIYHQLLALQNKKTRNYNEILKKARLYLTHFIRVTNMAITRGDLPAETRAFYGLATNDPTVPLMNTENELMSWGRRVIEGEEYRIRKGGTPITNPTIAVVKVRFENFIEAWTYHNTVSKRTYDCIEKNIALRAEADEVILRLWNEVEQSHESLPDEMRKSKCEDYGLVYFYRKNELEKLVESDTQNQNIA